MKPIELREADFKKAIEINIAYPSAMRIEFFNYWTEPNKSGTRMKWELEKTWHLGRRLARWANNDFGKGKVEVKKLIINEPQANEFTEINRHLLAYKARPTNFKVQDFGQWWDFLKSRVLLKLFSPEELSAICEAYPDKETRRAAAVMKTFDWYGAQGYLFSDLKN